MQFTKVHQELAKPLVEAILKIAEKAGKKCSKCKGMGKIRLTSERIRIQPRYTHIECSTCKGTGRVAGEWEWKPEWGEMVIYKKMIALITGVNPLKEDNQYDMLLQVSSSGVTPEIRARTEDVIPLLHWEDHLERILERMGYWISFARDPYNNYRVTIWKEGERIFEQSNRYKNRQESVQRAVLAVAEGLKEKG